MTFVLLFAGFWLLRGFLWQGNSELHTLMEVVATLLALNVGVLALVRFYSQKDNTFLFIGSGFLGTGLLDGYHAVVTSSHFVIFFPSPSASLVPWSWLASRLFLSVTLCLSWLFWKREQRLGRAGTVDPKLVY
ncbi:MAG: MASE3 domain-containing protein, partial [Steroidobacteraceae bacterium]